MVVKAVRKPKAESPKYDPDNPYVGMPTEVRIGSMIFRIEISEQADSAANSEFGHTNIINQKIRIQPRQSSLSLANTFLHECLHAIHWMYGLWRNEPDEEHYTNQTANGLCAFYQDNPEAMEWLLAINQRRGRE